jgi:tetratricopeptide (TPR) repeat protein
MADLSALLTVIEHDPDDAQALAALPDAARAAAPDARAQRFAVARKQLAARGRPDAIVALIDAELAATPDDRKVDLLWEKGMTLDGDLLDVAGARAAFGAVLAIRPGHEVTVGALAELDVEAKNWGAFAAKYVKEATASTDRSLATGLYLSAAEAYARFAPDSPEAEQYLKKALSIDAKNGKAAFHLARMLRRAQRWQDLGELLDERADAAASVDDRVAALIALAELSRGPIGNEPRAERAIKRALALDPAHPRALRWVTDAAAAQDDWKGVVAAYHAALKAKREDDPGVLLQIAMVLWKRLNDLDQAEDYFRRVRKIDPAHPAALDFYRAYYTARGESGKLLSMLRSVEKGAPRTRAESGDKSLGVEIAELAEAQGNPEKAIEAWKQQLRTDASSVQARVALARLYRKTEKWNALLDLMKEEIDRLPETDVEGRVARLFEVAEIYRDRLKLDVMVINTFNAILKVDPDNRRATDELAAKYRALGRWNDLIAILTRRSEAPSAPDGERVELCREVATLWADRFGNLANAIKPLERLLELRPNDTDALGRLKEIYTKRRQWRALVDLLVREAQTMPAAERRAKQGEAARLAAERLGDLRLAIEIQNSVLAEAAGADVADTLASLAMLYDREKRWHALAEILHRQVGGAVARKATKDAIVLLEKLGQVYAERLAAPAQAATAWKQILELEPAHAKALRTLRELYAMAGDFAGLEALYARLGQEDELVEALLAIADRLDGKSARLPLVERAAQLAQKKADAASDNAAALEKARQVWERVLAVEPQHVGAAAALAPIYDKQGKWARLLAVREIELAAASDRAARLAKIAQIRMLCEQKLSSRNLAFAWTVRAFDLDPTSDELFADVMRLAGEPDHWKEVVAAFERAIAGGELPEKTSLKLFRELARIASKKLGDPEKARGYHRRVLQLEPEDREAETHLEDLATHLADWQELLASMRKRALREDDGKARAQLLLDIAALQEEKLVDLDAAATTYREVLVASPGDLRALRALARIEEARGDWDALVDVLGQELAQTAEAQQRFDLAMRIGQLEEQHLDHPSAALAHFTAAFQTPPGPRSTAIDAVARYIAGPPSLEPKQRVAAARLVLPHLERARQFGTQAQALEVIRGDADGTPAEKVDIDRALMRLYHVDLGDPAAAWQAGLRVLAADPADADVRGMLGALAGQLGRDGEWAGQLASALANLRAGSASPAHVRAVATDLARVAGDRLDDRATAERAWVAVLEVEPDADDAFDALIGYFRDATRWTDLRALLERRADVSIDDRVKVATLLDLARLEEEMLGDASRAVAAYKRALELDAENTVSFQNLDRLYGEAKQWRELEQLLARALDHAALPARQVELLYRRAVLFARELNDPSRAVDLLEEVIAKSRGHADARELLEELLLPAATQPGAAPRAEAIAMRVARLLEPLYERDKLWRDLASVLRVQRRLVTGTEAVELLARIATIEETELAGARHAFDAWIEVLRLDPMHERARIELVRLAQWLARWPEATAALEAAAQATSDVASRAALLGELAAYYDAQAADPDRAIATYRQLLAVDPSNPALVRRAAAALARLYEDAEDWSQLRDVTRVQAQWAEDAAERHALLARVAAIEEEKLRDREAAIATWRDVVTDQPNDAGALHALERLYDATGKWRELIDILRRKVEAADHADAIALLGRIAAIHEQQLHEPDESIAAWLDVLDHDAHEPRALAELTRLYRAAERPTDLLDVLERQLAAAGDADRLALLVDIALLLAGPLARPVEALEKWEEVLATDPRHARALAAVEAATADPDLRAIAADVLLSVYGATAEDARLAELHLRIAGWTDDVPHKLRALGEVVRIRELRLDDKVGAFTAQLAALRVAASEPDLAHVVVDTERLAGELGREGELIDAYREVAPNVLDAEIQRRLYLDIADLARAVRQDVALAREYYQKVLDASPDDRRALAALENIFRSANDHERLVEILLRQASIGSDPNDRVGALVEAAQLYNELGRTDDAIATWEQVLELAPESGDASYALENLYEKQGRWVDVVDLYERRLGFVTSVEEAVALRVELGQIHEKQLRDIEAAVDNYAAALGSRFQQPAALAALERLLGDPDGRALAADVLEPIYVAQYRWHDLIRVYEAKLEAAADPSDRLRLTRFVARLYEEQLEDFENASRWYAKVFREAPADDTIRDQLQRLASVVDNWSFVAQTYQGYLDDETGETSELRDIAIAAAAIYDRRLGDVERAYRAYRRALAIDDETAVPDARELVRRLEEMLGRAQRWELLLAIYDDVIARGSDELRQEALVKRARLFEDGLGDPARAIDGWRDVVLATEDGGSAAEVHAYREAVGELERLYRQASRWRDLVDLLEARLSRAADAGEAAELRLRLAEVHEQHTNDLPAALDQYEQVILGGRAWERAVASLERLVVHEEHRERIAELLEPVYREQDWWQKLVVILDAKLAYIHEPGRQVATLHEIAALHEKRGGALDLALAALARAWRIDVADDAALAKLVSLAGKLNAWDIAVRTVEDGAASATGAIGMEELGADLWARAAEIHELRRDDRVRAIAAWREVDKARPDELATLAALDRLLALEGRVDELVIVVARRAELTEDAGVRLVLLHRVAALYEEVLTDAPKAIVAYKRVLDVDDTDSAALDALERLYRAAVATDKDAARELAAVLERKIELTSDLVARQRLRHAAAQVYERDLSDIYQAIAQLVAVLDDDAGDAAALAELDRIYGAQKLWPELLDVVDRRALLAISAKDRADLAFRAGKLVETELRDPEAAIPRYGGVLQVLPAHADARTALEALMAHDDHVDATTPLLERVFRGERDAQGLIRVYERRLALGAARRDPAARRADWEALADARETIANQPTQAFVVWERAIVDEPDAVDLLVPLERLATSQNLWPEFATTLDQLLGSADAILPPDVEATYAMKLGGIAEDRLNDLGRAAAAFERATHGPEPKPPLAALERVLARASKWVELADVLRREAEVADDDAQTAEYLFRAADLQETTLHDAPAAVATYREVLELVPKHDRARAALERMIASAPEQRRAIVEILEPLFDQDGDAARLVNVVEARLEITTDTLDLSSLLARIVELAEGALGDRGRALDAALRWLAIDPASQQALAETERLADRLGQWRETAMRVDAIVHAKDAKSRDDDVQVGLLVFLGRILRERLGQLDDAATTFRAALAIEPDSLAALDPLIAILRQRNDAVALADALRRRGEVATDPDERRAAFAEVGQLCERTGDRAGAVAAWRAIADRDDTDRDALDQLARLYRGEREAFPKGNDARRADLVDVLGRAARLARDERDEKALREEIARLEDTVAAWQAVVDLDPDDLAALRALEQAHARGGDWIAVADLQTRRLDLAKTTADKVAIHAEMARTAEERRHSTDDAVAAWFAALDVDNAHLPAYVELERLLAQGARWHDLVELLERRAELHATLSDTREELAALARAADVWEGKLDDPDAAGTILEKILAREPGSVAALTRLSRIYERAGDWDKCKRTLSRALELSPTGGDAADLFYRLGEVARVGDHDDATAIQHFQQALRHDASHAQAIAALEKLARERRDGAILADMLRRKVEMTKTAAERVALYVEIAELERAAGRDDAALAALAKAQVDAPDDGRVLGPLADLYFAAGRLDEAAPIYDRLAAEARAARRMKDVARYRQRQGGILEARGDRGGALGAYEEALRANPTDVTTMTGLGRLYFASGDWEKARKIYQSLVLQNIGEGVGVTKGEVYWTLGKIHIELGQGPKAKSMFQRGLEIEPGNQKLKEALSALA